MTKESGWIQRTHNCGELTRDDTDREVVLNGWVETVRDHGGLLFFDLRDRYGLTQVVFDAELTKTDVVGMKELGTNLIAFKFATVPAGIDALAFVHLFLVSTLLAYFPFSKLMHAGGVFMSPTRNLANTNRMKRHVNPWNYPVKVHTYDEYEEEFREKMKNAGIPVEKE